MKRGREKGKARVNPASSVSLHSFTTHAANFISHAIVIYKHHLFLQLSHPPLPHSSCPEVSTSSYTRSTRRKFTRWLEAAPRWRQPDWRPLVLSIVQVNILSSLTDGSESKGILHFACVLCYEYCISGAFCWLDIWRTKVNWRICWV